VVVLLFVLNVLLKDGQINAVFGEFIERSVEQIITAVWFGIEGFMLERGIIS
jgi:hypothetical protein